MNQSRVADPKGAMSYRTKGKISMRGLGLWEGDLGGWEAGLEALRLYVTYIDLSENPNWILRQKSDYSEGLF